MKSKRIIINHIKATTLVCIIYLLPIIIIVSFIATEVSLSADWDIWAIWLPMAKSISEGGTFLFHTYFLSNIAVATVEPYVPFIYAFNLTVVGDLSKLVPIIYYLLLGLATYLLSKSLFKSENVAIGASIFCTTSLVLMATLFGYTLHPDIPTGFFICAALVFLLKVLKGPYNKSNLLFLGMTLCLLILDRRLGLVVTCVILSFLLLRSYLPFRRSLFVLVFSMPFIFYILINLNSLKLFQILPLYLLYIIILIWATKRINLKPYLDSKSLLVLFPLIPALIYLIVIGFSSGVWAYWSVHNPDYLSVYHFFKSIYPSPGVPIQINFWDLLRLDDIFLRYGFLITALFIPVGLLSVLKNKTEAFFVLGIMIMFLLLLTTDPNSFYPSFGYNDTGFLRRYIYFLPIVALLASKGFFWIHERHFYIKNSKSIPFHLNIINKKNVPLITLFSFLVYNSLAIFYLMTQISGKWPYPLSSISAISELRTCLKSYATYYDLFILFAIFFISIALNYILHRIYKNDQN